MLPFTCENIFINSSHRNRTLHRPPTR